MAKIDKKRTRIVLGAVVMLAVAAAGMYAGVFYVLKRQVEETSRIVSELEEERGRKDIANEMQKILADTKAQRERLDDFFVHSTHVVDFIQEIERLGGVAGVETVISNLDEQDNRLSFSVKTEGTYTQVTHFMMLLDALPYNLKLQKAFLSKSGPGTTWNGNFTASLFSFIQP